MTTGAWCWFSDPRAIYSATHDRTYSGFVATNGDIVAVQFDHSTGQQKEVVVRAALNVDDHANPSFLEMPGGRIYVFYAHHQDSDIRFKWTGPNGDLSVMSPEYTFGLPAQGIHVPGCTYSYCNPVYLPSCGRVMVFFRQNLPDDTNRWFVALNENQVGTVTFPAYPIWATGTGKGPYIKVMRHGDNVIDIIATTDHPGNAVCDVYYFRFVHEGGSTFRWQNASGVNATGVPLGPSQATLVQSGAPVGNTWIWQVSRDAGGAPVALMSTYPGNTTDEHKYRFARWNGTGFNTTEICSAGGALVPGATPSRYYSGGASFDGNDPSKVYLSRESGGLWSVEKWATTDNGATWALDEVVSPSASGKVIRPFAPKGASADLKALWMRGRYDTYVDYAATLEGDFPPTAEELLIAACISAEADNSNTATVIELAARIRAVFE
jgi:hypothetical protein